MKNHILFLGLLLILPIEQGVSKEPMESVVKPRPSIKRHARTDGRVMKCLEAVACLETSSFKNKVELNKKGIQLGCSKNKLTGAVFTQRSDKNGMLPRTIAISHFPKTEKSTDSGWYISDSNISFDTVRHVMKSEIERFLTSDENKLRWQMLSQSCSDIKSGAKLRGLDLEDFEPLMKGLVACESVYPDLIEKFTTDQSLAPLQQDISERAALAKSSLKRHVGSILGSTGLPAHESQETTPVKGE